MMVPLLMTGAGPGTLMVKTRGAVPVPTAFVALKVTVKTPVAIGVPEITPVVASIDRPRGRPVAPKLVGTLLAAVE